MLRHEPIDHPRDLLIFGMEKLPVISSISEVSDVLGNEQQNSNKKIYEEYYGKVDGCSTERVADAIVECCTAENKLDSTIEFSFSEKRFLLKRNVFNKVSRFFNKTGLLKIFHWPRSAYNQKNDIP